MLTNNQQAEFTERGYIRLEGAFSSDQATAMQDLIWEDLISTYGIDKGDPTSWSKAIPPLKFHHLKGHEAFKPIGGSVVVEALDQLMGKGQWKPPYQWGQFLVAFPKNEPWHVPGPLWHADFAFSVDPDPLPGILFISLLSDVPREHGATLVMDCSHRLMEKYVKGQDAEARAKMKRIRKGLMASHPWLEELNLKSTDSHRKDTFMEKGAEIAGIPLKVTELTGKAGDVILGHPWLLHSPAPNCGEQLKIMRVQRIHRLQTDRNLCV